MIEAILIAFAVFMGVGAACFLLLVVMAPKRDDDWDQAIHCVLSDERCAHPDLESCKNCPTAKKFFNEDKEDES